MPEPASALSPEEAAQLVEVMGARHCATAHVRAPSALLSPGWRPAALVALHSLPVYGRNGTRKASDGIVYKRCGTGDIRRNKLNYLAIATGVR